MIDWTDQVGQRALQRIQSEQVIWLTTLSKSGFPQPRPVWFVWDGQSFFIYTTPQAWKIPHIQRHPQVALHFNTDQGGEDIQVFLGTASIDTNAPPAHLNKAYIEKYHDGILSIGMTDAAYGAMFTVAIRITALRLRGLEPLPEQEN